MRFLPWFAMHNLVWRSCLLPLLLCLAALARADAYDDFMFAVKFDDVKSVQSLLVRGIDPNSVEAVRGESALMIAVREKSSKVFSELLRHPDIQLEVHARNGDTALMLACYLGNRDAVSRMIAAGAQINRSGWSALHYAAANGDIDIIALLLQHAALIDAAAPNKSTPLMMAVSARKMPAIQLLLAHGADLTVKNDAGMAALDFAAYFEYPEIEEYFIALKTGGKRP